MIWHLCNQYFSYSILSNIEIKHDVVTTFPAVTICDRTIFNTQEGIAFLKDTLKTFKITRNGPLHELKLKFAKSSLLNNSTIYNDFELRKKMSKTLDQMIFECTFGSKDCNVSDFVYFFDINHGNCYRFNSGLNRATELKTVITSGDKTGLRLGLHLGSPNDFFDSTGVFVEIHDQSFRGLSTNSGFNVPTGAITSIGIKRKFYDKLNPPYNECIKHINVTDGYDSDLFRATIEMAGIYSRSYCFKLCVTA